VTEADAPSALAKADKRPIDRRVGISHSTVQRTWSKSELKPHVIKTFKLSSDPNFEAKFWDIIGLYFDPPTNAIVLAATKRANARRWNARNLACLSRDIGRVQ